MSNTTGSAVLRVFEDQPQSFNITALLAQVGQTPPGPLEVVDVAYVDPLSGELVYGSLMFQVDGSTLRIDPSSLPDWFGSFSSITLVFDLGSGELISLDTQVYVDPVNDAPTGADSEVTLEAGQSWVLGESVFGFQDVHYGEAHALRSVILTGLPAHGTVLLDGVAVLAGQEISVADLAAGKLSYVADPQYSGDADLAFLVRDDGGTANGGQDTASTAQHITVHLQPASGGGDLPARIGDTVFIDTDGNGLQDTDEVGQAGVTVRLLDANGQTVASAVTDAAGHYTFLDIAPGSYWVQFDAPPGYVLSTPESLEVTVGAGDEVGSADAGLVRLGHIGDTVFLDANADGVQGPDEVGQAGVTVSLRDANGDVVATATTDAQGRYGFDVRPGTYSVSVALPAGWLVSPAHQGSDAAADSDVDATGQSAAVVVASGASVDVDAGLYQHARLGDRVFVDANANGLLDGSESGLAGVVVQLLDTNGAVLTTTTTDASGNYQFSELVPGRYAVQFVAPSGYTYTLRDQGSDDSTDSDAGADGRTNWITLGSGQALTHLDAGLVALPPLTGSVGDKVWHDLNGNGTQDSGEAGLGCVSVKLLNSTGQVVATTTTDASGNYHFSNVAAGSYAVQFVGPSGYVYTAKDVGSDTTDSDAGSDGKTAVFTVAAGQDVTHIDAGLYKTASIGDKVWVDGNGDGQQGSCGESGLCGVVVKLLNAAGAVVASTTTDASGNYKFANLAPGSYAVQFVAPTGYTYTTRDVGSDTTDSDAGSDGKTGYYTLKSGEAISHVDAGLKLVPVAKASVGDKVWEDKNFNGVQDAGEAGVAGVTVKLLSSSGAVLASTTTNASGAYQFSGLNAGSYKVQVVTPSGYYCTKQDQGSNDASDSDVGSSGLSNTFNLSAGQALTTLDAGIYRKAMIGNKVWADWDHDNVQDVGEGCVKNVKVMLQDSCGNTLATTYTDSNGLYCFKNLDPGTYRLAFDKTQGIHTADGASVYWWGWAKANVGCDDSRDFDAYNSYNQGVATTAYTQLESGENDMSWDAACTPIAIDLDGNGIQTVARDASQAGFDLFGTGQAVRSGWISGGDGFLAIDANGNGRIDDIHELFGGTQQGQAFAKLASFDSNGDGVVNASDARFAELSIWRDANGNHQTDAGELISLAQAGVAALRVQAVALPFLDAQHNLHLERSQAELADGRSVDMTDVYFNVAQADAQAAGVTLPRMADLLGDDGALDTLVGAAQASTAHVPTLAPAEVDSSALLRQLAALSHAELALAA